MSEHEPRPGWQRFCQCLEAYGAEPARWPEAERELFERFAGEPEAEALIAEARWLDAELDRFPSPAPDAAFAETILARIRPTGASIHVVPGRRRWALGMGLAASVLLGFGLGWRQAPMTEVPDLFGGLLFGPSSAESVLQPDFPLEAGNSLDVSS